uniref:AP complex subunit sigma n=1 Tax=Arcella intermedia TaxID=1963864 RepID=A0A6B2LPP3_9EUKA
MSQYFSYVPMNERLAMEGEIIRKCLGRSMQQCSFVEYRDHKVVYRRYASLFIIMGIDETENELAILELIHLFVETLDKYFDSVCELDIMFSLDRVHMILNEVVLNGQIIETNKKTILDPVQFIDTQAKKNA